MVVEKYEPLYNDKGCLTTEILETYRNEEDKLSYATMRLLYYFFQRGIDLNLNHEYIDVLSNNLERISTLVFSPVKMDLTRLPDRSITRMMHFAKKPELVYLLATFRFYEDVFAAFEEYEVCFNIHHLDGIIQKTLLLK